MLREFYIQDIFAMKVQFNPPTAFSYPIKYKKKIKEIDHFISIDNNQTYAISIKHVWKCMHSMYSIHTFLF